MSFVAGISERIIHRKTNYAIHLKSHPILQQHSLRNLLGVERLQISIVKEDGRHHVTVGDTVAYTGRPEINENGEAVQITGLNTHPAPDILALAPVKSIKVSAMGIEYGGENLSDFTPTLCEVIR